MQDYGISLGKVFFVGLLCTILTVDAIFGFQALYYWQLARAESSDSLYPPAEQLEKLQTAQLKRLTDYWVVDPKTNTIAIPVSRAMEIVVADLSHPSAQPKGKTP